MLRCNIFRAQCHRRRTVSKFARRAKFPAGQFRTHTCADMPDCRDRKFANIAIVSSGTDTYQRRWAAVHLAAVCITGKEPVFTGPTLMPR